jgi:uncharacterized protein YabE (DUF348 family)
MGFTMAAQDKAWKPEHGLRPRARRGRAPGLLAAPIFLTLAALLIVGYQRTLTRVTLVVDGQERTVRTHQMTVEAVLREAGLTLYPEDIVEPAPSDHPVAGMTVTIQRARPVVVEVDGHAIQARTQLTVTQDVLTELGVNIGHHDQVRVLSDQATNRTQPAPIHIRVARAVPVTVHEAGRPPLHFYTTASIVGTALHEAGIVLYLADDVRPSLSSPVKPGTLVSINRSTPVTIHVDGHTLRARTHRFTVGDVLADMGILLQGLDYAEPDLGTSLGDGQAIRVVRVREEVLVQQEPIPFETQWAPDPELEIDHQKLGQEGERGVFERRVRVRYEDGVEVSRWNEAEWVAKAPRPKILNYGTKIVLRTIDTPSGSVQYWRKFRMFATSYTAASAGKSPDHPRYGITRLGVPMRFGIVAVDPRVVRLGSQVYVPGYGVGYAADTGGAILGPRIDLGYDESNLVLWYRCVDVYLLAPAPDSVDYITSSLSHPRCR